MTSGGYSREALDLERQRQNLRLLGGAEITELRLQHYGKPPPDWRARLPLRPVLVVDREPEHG